MITTGVSHQLRHFFNGFPQYCCWSNNHKSVKHLIEQRWWLKNFSFFSSGLELDATASMMPSRKKHRNYLQLFCHCHLILSRQPIETWTICSKRNASKIKFDVNQKKLFVAFFKKPKVAKLSTRKKTSIGKFLCKFLYDSLVRNLIYNKEEVGVLSVVIFHCEIFSAVIKNINF